MIRAVIFDFNDTLIPSSQIIKDLDAERVTFNCLEKKAILNNWSQFIIAQEKTDLEYKRKYENDVRKYRPDFYLKLLFYHLNSRKPNSKELQSLRKCSNQYYAEFIKRMRLNPSVLATLKTLKQKGIKLFLVSNGNKETITRRLKKFALPRFFEKIIISSEVGEQKASLWAFRKVLMDLNVPPKEILVVGDRKDEDAYAKKLGMQTAILQSSERKKYFKKPMEPDYKIRLINEIKKIVFNKKQKKSPIGFEYFALQWPLSRKKYGEKDFQKEFKKLGVPSNEKDYRSMDLSRFWIKLFKQTGLRNDSRVLEFCTGLAPKTIYALGLANFSGDYFSVDTTKKVSAMLKKIVDNLKLKFSYKILSNKKTVQKLNNLDFVVSNHGVDDLFFYFFCKEKKISYFDYLRDEKAEKLVELVNGDKDLFEKAVEKTTREILFYTTKLKHNGYLLLSNYPPFIDIKRTGTKRINLLKKVSSEVCKKIIQRGFCRLLPLGLNTIKTPDNKNSYWIILKKTV